jgi:DNA recombination protein RmuC
MDTTLIIIVFVLILANVFLVILVMKKGQGSVETSSTMLLKEDIDRLNDNVLHLKEGLKDQITDKLDSSQRLMNESITRQFKTSSRLIADVTERLAKLDETNKRVVDVAGELKVIQNVLQNPKQRGVLGEYLLESVLQNVLPPERFQMQYKFKDGETVDAVIKLDKNRILPIDSKFSRENYNRLIEESSKDARVALVKTFLQDLKNRIDETSKYIRPSEGTMDFAFMFIPSEAIYYDLLVARVGQTGSSSRDLVEYAFKDKNVIIVSPTSFMAYLQTVMQGLRSLQIEEQAKEIQIRVAELGRHIASYDTVMGKLGSSLGTTVNHYNKAHNELKKIDKDVTKITSQSPEVKPLLIDKPVDE